MLYLTAALLLIIAVLFGITLWEHKAIQSMRTAEQAALKVNQVEITQARDTHETELAALRSYRNSHPDSVPVQLCKPVVHTVTKTVTVPGPATAGVQSVHDADNPVRAAEPAPDLFGMLSAFASRCDAVSADLREQQAVH